jgi:hypothetical protein
MVSLSQGDLHSDGTMNNLEPLKKINGKYPIFQGEQVKQIIELYKNTDITVNVIKQIFEISNKTLYNIIDMNGIPRRTNG